MRTHFHARVVTEAPDGSWDTFSGPGESTEPISDDDALRSAEAAALAEAPEGARVVDSSLTD